MVAGLGTAIVLDWPPLQAGAAMVVALLFSAGPLSPDLDQHRGWRLTDRVLPDEALGNGGPLQHRGITHWWGLPAAVAATLPLVPPAAGWVLLSALAGWCSHLVGDFVFGRADRFCGRGPGIPTAPWWGHVGVGLDTGGRTESFTRALVLPAVAVWQGLVVIRVDGAVLEFLRRVVGG
jgi:hypothetical protein